VLDETLFIYSCRVDHSSRILTRPAGRNAETDIKMASQMTLELPDDRHDRLRRLVEATGERTKAGAIDVAMQHYLRDLRNKERVAGDLDREILEELSTPWLPLSRETAVGPTAPEHDD
jgi:hypothetical protein